jgi:DNA-binding GntR family transcriptional regulator
MTLRLVFCQSSNGCDISVIHQLGGQMKGVSKASQPAAVRAYHMLERMVVTLDLPPGAITTEGALIEKIRLGRTPVREAIQRLAWEGLIEIRPRAGLVIAPLDRADWPKVIDAREGVEILLARSAARFATGPIARRFREAAIRMEQAVVKNSPLAFLDADKLLDETLAEAADNPFAARLAAPLQTHSRRFWFRYHAGSGLALAAEQHVRLIRAILELDAESAAREAGALMRLLKDYAEAAARA